MSLAPGYIPISRKLFEHEFWKEKRSFSKFEAWIDLIALVSYEEEKSLIIGLKVIKWGRGQYPASIRFLQNRWNWGSTKRVKLFLDLLEKENMIKLDRETGQNVITICNYDIYNAKPKTGKQEGNTEGNAGETLGKHLGNESNKGNKYKEDIITPAEAAAPVDSPFVEKEAPPKKQFTFEDKYRYFIHEVFNSLTGKKCRGDVKSKAAFKARLAEGYTSEDFKAAIKACVANDFHKENGYVHLTPEFITRSDKLEKFLNHAKVIPIGSMENKRAEYVPKPPMSDEEYNALFPVGKVEIKRENLIKFGFAI